MKLIHGVCTAAAAAVLLGGIQIVRARGENEAAAAGAPPPPVVTVAPVQEREWVEHDEFTGRVEAQENVEIRPRVSGYLTAVRFRAGQSVARGDVLFEIDARPFRSALKRAESELAVARVRLDLTARDAERGAGLLAQKAISQEEADQRKARHEEAKALVEGGESLVTSARIQLEHTEIRAPVAGRMGRPLVTVGNNVSGQDGVTTLLATLVSVDPMFVDVDIDEATLLRLGRLIRSGRSEKSEKDAKGRVAVRMGLSDEVGYPREGYVEALDNRLDSGTGSIVLRTEFPNADGSLVPGMFARLQLPVGGRVRSLWVPEVAVGTDQGQRFVLTLTGTNTVEYRKVVLGPGVAGQRVVREGLKAGDRVVVNGLQRVRPGAHVTPQEESGGGGR